jgi:acyl-[acyl-carrier-protein]-phospholipid O-acyltransferase/long-chain-fatty-acid--[acyl-carrier-protein] ligase
LSPLSPAATCRPAPPETSNLKSQISPPASTSPLHAAIAQTRARLIASIQKLTPQQAAANPSPGQPAADPADRPAVILFTSGSSGLPKGVVLSHRNLQTNRHQLVAVLDVTSRDRFFSSLPVFHAFGLTGGVIAPLLHGTPVFMYPTPLHYGIIPELVYQTNSTVLFGTNTFLAGYAKRAHPYDLYSVRFAVAGAEKLKDETRRLFSQKFGVRVFDAYGVTEASPGVCINTPMHNRPGTVGQFLPGIEWRLDPVPGIPRGGRLWIRSANIMLGYLLHDQPGQLQPLPDGWYDTGDIVDVDADGYVTILGRAKRFAKIAGEMVSLTLVEDLAASLWPDNQHAAITRPHPQKGEEILLVTDAPDASRAALQEAAKSRGFPELALPRQILIEPAIPLLGSGKPDYPALEKLHNPSATS